MLKSLGATMAQVAQRVRPRGSPSATPRFDRNVFLARRAERRRRRKTVLVLSVAFLLMVGAFSAVFHELMAREGRSFSWPTSVYWTLTTMTTLGFGDITFESDAGRIFSVIVLLSGSTFLLVMLPFVFIQFVFIPWMDERDRRRAPRSLPAGTEGHVIVTSQGPVEEALIDRAVHAEVPYVVIVEDVDVAGRMHDEGRTVMVGNLDDPQTYERARVTQATVVVATQNDQTNTNIAFTVREIAPRVKVVATANSPASVDILEIAGANHVVRLGEILGAAMAARGLGLGGRSHEIGSFAGLQIAEAGVAGTDLVGHTLAESKLRQRFGVGLIGVWERGDFSLATPETVLRESSVLLLAGSAEQLASFDRALATDSPATASAVIIGGGRVGRAIGRALTVVGMDFTIVEQLAERARPEARYVIGDAADRDVLAAAGIDEASSIFVTSHDDNVNVYLTRYCRGLRPDARIVSRSRLDRNVSTLYRAGADAVLSYAGAGSAAIWNHFRGEETLLVAHGLNLFRTPIPSDLAGKTLAEAHVYRRTKCNVVAVQHEGKIQGNPDATAPLPAGGELVMIGTNDAEARFSEVYPGARRRSLRDSVRR
ncbi:MAG: potassium channel protein [Acidimicrobiales bacterium]|nr:potassium channel protein [Acidimicrobiales bacterium]